MEKATGSENDTRHTGKKDLPGTNNRNSGSAEHATCRSWRYQKEGADTCTRTAAVCVHTHEDIDTLPGAGTGTCG
eukprot:3317018-Heterocapsa_arctica.AAC.1